MVGTVSVSFIMLGKVRFREDAETSTRGACATRKVARTAKAFGAARTPGGVIGGDGFLGELLAGGFGEGRGGRGGYGVAHLSGINLEARKPEKGFESGK